MFEPKNSHEQRTYRVVIASQINCRMSNEQHEEKYYKTLIY